MHDITTEEGRQALAKFLDNVASFDCAVKPTAAGIDSASSAKIDHKFVNAIRFRPRGGGVVKIYQLVHRSLH
jgi:hypothetical protein